MRTGEEVEQEGIGGLASLLSLSRPKEHQEAPQLGQQQDALESAGQIFNQSLLYTVWSIFQVA